MAYKRGLKSVQGQNSTVGKPSNECWIVWNNRNIHEAVCGCYPAVLVYHRRGSMLFIQTADRTLLCLNILCQQWPSYIHTYSPDGGRVPRVYVNVITEPLEEGGGMLESNQQRRSPITAQRETHRVALCF